MSLQFGKLEVVLDSVLGSCPDYIREQRIGHAYRCKDNRQER